MATKWSLQFRVETTQWPLGGFQVEKKTQWPPNGPSKFCVKMAQWPRSLQEKKNDIMASRWSSQSCVETTQWPLSLQVQKKTDLMATRWSSKSSIETTWWPLGLRVQKKKNNIMATRFQNKKKKKKKIPTILKKKKKKKQQLDGHQVSKQKKGGDLVATKCSLISPHRNNLMATRFPSGN